MSRSIHTTRRTLARLEAEDVSRADVRAAAVERARGELERKRRVKQVAARARRPHQRGHTAPDTVPILVCNAGPWVHYLAGVEDVRELLRRFPRGVTDGLRRVELRLGRQTHAEWAAKHPRGEEPDPFTGRLSSVRYPGIWAGCILGRYRPSAAAIELYAYVFDPAHPLRAFWEPLLRLNALSTLAHEVAHHYDFAGRDPRGRWRTGGSRAIERYAERMQYEWTKTIVLPYLRERYPGELTMVEEWVEAYGGVSLPFEELVDDPRRTGRGRRVNAEILLWAMSDALEALAEAVDQREPRWECRLRFARELYFQSRYRDALAVAERVLRARPREPRALLLKADVLLRTGLHEAALEIGRALARRAPATEHAWRVIADACEALGRWDEAEAAFARRLELVQDDERHAIRVLLERVELRIRSGQLAGARADLERIGSGGSAWLQRRVAKLRARIETTEGKPPCEYGIPVSLISRGESGNTIDVTQGQQGQHEDHTFSPTRRLVILSATAPALRIQRWPQREGSIPSDAPTTAMSRRPAIDPSACNPSVTLRCPRGRPQDDVGGPGGECTAIFRRRSQC